MIKLIISDCDGVLTNGQLFYGENGEKLKIFNVKDGTAIKALISRGYKFGVISGRRSKALETRCQELGMHFCYTGVDEKGVVIEQLQNEFGIRQTETLFVGDDLNDCVAKDRCGVLLAVNDASPLLLAVADHRLETKGGSGVFQEIFANINEY